MSKLWPVCLGTWSRLPDGGYDGHGIFVSNGAMVIINRHREPNKVNPHGVYVCSYSRTDGLFEHIFKMGDEQ